MKVAVTGALAIVFCSTDNLVSAQASKRSGKAFHYQEPWSKLTVGGGQLGQGGRVLLGGLAGMNLHALHEIFTHITEAESSASAVVLEQFVRCICNAQTSDNSDTNAVLIEYGKQPRQT